MMNILPRNPADREANSPCDIRVPVIIILNLRNVFQWITRSSYTPLAVVSRARTRINHCSTWRKYEVNILAKCWFCVQYKNFGSYELREPRLYACQLYSYSCLHYALSNLQPIKKRLMFLSGFGPIAIADWSSLVHCHLLVKHWVLASNDAVFEMGDLIRTLKRLLTASIHCFYTNVKLYML
jgi:hypothetical protein